MPADKQIVSAAVEDGNSDYQLPASMGFRLKAVNATFADNGAGQEYLPAVILISDAGHVIAHAVDTDVSVAAGGSAETSFFPGVRRRLTGSGLTLDYNVGEIGHSITTALGTTGAATVTYQDVQAGDGVLVLAMAPSLPSGVAPVGLPVSVADTAGNTYALLQYFQFEAFPANVNEGVSVALFWCSASRAKLVAGSATITATWDNPVFDRVVSVWTVRHSGGANTPTVNNFTADNDAAVFASGQVTLGTNAFNPSRDQALMFALVISAKAGGVGGFSSVAGFTGFFQAEFRLYTGAKQSYLVNPQTFGADAYLIAGAVPAPFEDDIGVLPANVLVPAFNGVGQKYTTGTNAWKGVILLALD